MNKPKLILFDIGGVFKKYPDVFIKAYEDSNIEPPLLDKTFDKYYYEITYGQITPQELYVLCLKENNLKADENYNFLESWVSDYTPIKETYDFVLSLKGKYKLGLFSNIYKGTVPELIKRGFIPDIGYDYTFLSCDLGMQKPDLKIYDYIEQNTGLVNGDILFIDDKEEYLKPAIDKSWQVVLFETNNPKNSIKKLEYLHQ